MCGFRVCVRRCNHWPEIRVEGESQRVQGEGFFKAEGVSVEELADFETCEDKFGVITIEGSE